MLAVYTASKAAVNAYTESLALELAPIGVRVGLVIPGEAPGTPFGQNAQALMAREGLTIPEAYADLARRMFEALASGRSGPRTEAVDVAEAIWQVANDPSAPVRHPAGADAVALAGAA